MSDVLFDTGSYTLRPAAREKLAKISGILLAYPGLKIQIEGHTDSVGGATSISAFPSSVPEWCASI
jgi:outer membrane protein OmpA-like peptidoglycan-associated protein